MTRTGRLSAALAHYAVEILSVLACVSLVAIVAAAAWLSYRQHSESERALQRDHAGDMALVLEVHARGTLSSVDDAVRSAIAMQQRCNRHNANLPPEEQVLLCLGIGFGDVLRIGDQDVYGAEVNTACKLGEDTAQAHEILLSNAVAEAVRLPNHARLTPLDDLPEAWGKAFKLHYDSVILRGYNAASTE